MNPPSGDARRRWVRSALEEFEGPLLRYAQRITGDLERARDVVQETFLRLWRERPESLDGRLPQWLYTVCRNYALDVRRKETRMTTLAEPLAVEAPATDPSPEQAADLNDTADCVLHWLTMLPDNQQEVIRLRFQNDLRYRQIAEVTGLTVTNVGLLIHKGLKTLREKARPLMD